MATSLWQSWVSWAFDNLWPEVVYISAKDLLNSECEALIREHEAGAVKKPAAKDKGQFDKDVRRGVKVAGNRYTAVHPAEIDQSSNNLVDKGRLKSWLEGALGYKGELLYGVLNTLFRQGLQGTIHLIFVEAVQAMFPVPEEKPEQGLMVMLEQGASWAEGDGVNLFKVNEANKMLQEQPDYWGKVPMTPGLHLDVQFTLGQQLKGWLVKRLSDIGVPWVFPLEAQLIFHYMVENLESTRFDRGGRVVSTDARIRLEGISIRGPGRAFVVAAIMSKASNLAAAWVYGVLLNGFPAMIGAIRRRPWQHLTALMVAVGASILTEDSLCPAIVDAVSWLGADSAATACAGALAFMIAYVGMMSIFYRYVPYNPPYPAQLNKDGKTTRPRVLSRLQPLVGAALEMEELAGRDRADTRLHDLLEIVVIPTGGSHAGSSVGSIGTDEMAAVSGVSSGGDRGSATAPRDGGAVVVPNPLLAAAINGADGDTGRVGAGTGLTGQQSARAFTNPLVTVPGASAQPDV